MADKREAKRFAKANAKVAKFKMKNADYREDLVEATSRLFTRPAASQLRVLNDMVPSTERVLGAALAFGFRSGGFLVLTNQAIHVRSFRTGFVPKLHSESFPLSSVSTVEVLSTSGVSAVKVNASGSTAEVSPIARLDAESFAELSRAAVSNARSSASGSTSSLDQIAKLAELHKAGVLSDTEFESKKAELLGRI